MSTDVGRKLQSCREEEEEEDENAQTLTSPHKNKTNTCHSIKPILINWLAQQQLISEFQLRVMQGQLR
jgi:hypothetical protein